ncbi:MAG TPA: glycosyltransferase family 1 protein [Terriglobales bacterium]|nr:glycosyltransferase family 1 protein [Terriglobales bacterium]
MHSPHNIRVAVDGWYLGEVHRNTGIYAYTRALLEEMRELAPNFPVEITPFVPRKSELASAPGFQPGSSPLLASERLWRYGGAWITTMLRRPDVLFSPSVNSLYGPMATPVVTTIHDLSPVLMPNFAPPAILRKLRLFLNHAVRSSARLIAISESCKRDLMRVYRVPESKISVVYSGCDHSRFNPAQPQAEHLARLKAKHNIARPYVFHHGLIQPRKNLKRLIEAWAQILARNPELQLDLVLAGKLGWQSDELITTAKTLSSDRGRVVFTGPLSDEDLPLLLKGGLLVAIPSLYEGFCLPMVEAMACGVPVIAAKGSCLEEISGGILRYFDPESVHGIAMCIESAITNDSLRQELAAAGLKRAQRFCWRRTAEETLNVLIKTHQASIAGLQ